VETLKEIRRQKGWSQKDLADSSGVGQDTISGIESGRHEPRPSTLRKLAEALGVQVADFFREPAFPKAPAREAGQPEKEKPIFDVVRDALLRQAEQDRQAFMRAVESGSATYTMRHENEAMNRLLEHDPRGELAEAYIDLMWRLLTSEQEREQLTREVETLRRRLEEVGV
jgi:transcriptional regulator with XRE-family HTH domain